MKQKKVKRLKKKAQKRPKKVKKWKKEEGKIKKVKKVRKVSGLSSCMQILVRTVHTVQQTVEISQLQFLGWLSTCLLGWSGWVVQKTVEPPQWQFWVRPVLGQGCCARWCNDWGPRNAWFNYGYMSCIIQGGFWKNFMIFYVAGCLGS